MLREFIQDDIEFMRETSAVALLGPRVFSHLILWGTLLFVFVALIWAYFAKLDEVTMGEGKVIPSSQVQIVQNLEGGILSELLVHEGEAVEKDQVLLKIDDTRFSSSYREGRSKYVALTAKAARLDAEVTQTEFIVPVELEKDAPDLVQNEKALYLSRKSDLETKTSILRQQADQRRQQLVELRSKQAQQGQSYELVVKELNLSRPLM
ncbi:MAG: biotin/lipoyl-binding protein, partial [Gammaproteobacteria bacterium]